ncbi:MAG: hypothetical protein K2R98_08475 [Gemmataceae bacterium]|nr:hypothetical protein [Gemmataceae bacterium]
MSSPVPHVDPATKQKLEEWMRLKLPNFSSYHCPLCGMASGWIAGPLVAMPANQGGAVNFGTLVPVLPLTCSNCAYVLSLNAALVGLVPANPTGTP